MTTDTELDGWRQQWTHQPVVAIPADLRRRVERESRRMRWSLIPAALATVAIGVTFTLPATQPSGTYSIVLAGAVWLFSAVAWSFALWNNAGNWQPETETTTAFLEISTRRCRAFIRAAPFGVLLYVAELTFCIGWILSDGSASAARTPSAGLTSWPMVAIGWIGLPAFCLFVFWQQRRKRQELRALESLRASLT